MVHAPRGPATSSQPLLSIFRPLFPRHPPSPSLPMWEGKLFSYILSSPSRAGKQGDDGARSLAAAAARYPGGRATSGRGCPAWGAGAGGCPVGASAAPSLGSADFDPPWRTAPARRGGLGVVGPARSAPRAPGLAMCVWGGHADLCPPPPPARCTVRPGALRAGCGGPRRARVVASSLGSGCVCRGSPRRGERRHRGGQGAGTVTGTGRRPGASEAGPAAAGALSAAQLWSALGNFCPPAAGPIFFLSLSLRVLGFPFFASPASRVQRGWWGGGVGRGRCSAAGPTPASGRPPAPPPRSRSLRRLRP